MFHWFLANIYPELYPSECRLRFSGKARHDPGKMRRKVGAASQDRNWMSRCLTMILATLSPAHWGLRGFHAYLEGGHWIAAKPVSGPFIMTSVACFLSLGVRAFSLTLLISVV